MHYIISVGIEDPRVAAFTQIELYGDGSQQGSLLCLRVLVSVQIND